MKKLLAFLANASQRLQISGRTKASNDLPQLAVEKKTMDIFCIETGKVFYEVDETLGAILCEGLSNYFRRAVKRNAAPSFPTPAAPQWSINRAPLNDRVFFIQVKIGAQVYKVDGTPAQATKTFAGLGLHVPGEILEQYAAATSQKV